MTEKITNIVIEKIENFTYGYVFTASDFPIVNNLFRLEARQGGAILFVAKRPSSTKKHEYLWGIYSAIPNFSLINLVDSL